MNKTKYSSGDLRHLINEALQAELAKLPDTLEEIKDPVQKLNIVNKLIPYVCAPIKQVNAQAARVELGENNLFNF